MQDWDEIAALLKRVAEEGENAWPEMLTQLSPILDGLARRQPIGRLRDDLDVQRDIVTKVISKLHSGEFRVIKKFVVHDDPPPLRAWVRVLVRSAAIDVMRGRPEYSRGNRENLPGWFSLATLATHVGANQPKSLEVKQREVEAFLANAVMEATKAVKKNPDEAAKELADAWQIQALHTRRVVKRIEYYEPILRMVLAGHTYVEISEELELSRREVELIVGYIEEFFHARGFAA